MLLLPEFLHSTYFVTGFASVAFLRSFFSGLVIILCLCYALHGSYVVCLVAAQELDQIGRLDLAVSP